MSTLSPNRKRCSPGSKRMPKGSRTCVRKMNYAVPVDNYNPNLPFAPASWMANTPNYAIPVDNYNPNLPFAPVSFIPKKKSKKSSNKKSGKSSNKKPCKYGRRHLNKCPTKSQSNSLKLKVAKDLQKRYRDRIAKKHTGPLIYDPDDDEE